MIRVIIIDDEPSAANVLKLLLEKKHSTEAEIVAISNSPQEGKALIEMLKPDLVFLDIEMPGMTGIDLVRSFPAPDFHFVFVTAFDDYAVEAFKLCAINYLLKPIGPDSLFNTIERVKKEMGMKDGVNMVALKELDRLLYQHYQTNDDKIGIAMSDKIVFLKIPEILYCEAEGGYTNIFQLDGTRILSSKALGEFENQLSGHDFFRIHHSILINLKRVKEFQRNDGGYVVMENGKSLEVSQRKRKDFLQLLQRYIV